MALAYYRPGKAFDIRTYWMARFSRIYPIYILAFILTCVRYLDILSKVKLPKIIANIFLYQAWIPAYALSYNIAAWSLSVEAFFYLIFPLLIFLAKRQSTKQVIWFSAAFWVISQFVHSILMRRFTTGAENFLAFFPLFHINAFLLGLAGGIWYLNRSPQVTNHRGINRIGFITSLATTLYLINLHETQDDLFRGLSLDVGLLAPLFLIIILTLAMDTTRLSSSLSHPWLVTLGEASYALYILHIPIRWLIEQALMSAQSTLTINSIFPGYVLFTIAISLLVIRYIERPARDWLRTNPHKLTKILVDIILILAMIRFSFFLRLGQKASTYLQTQTFALRVGMVIFILALLVFRYYSTYSWRSLAIAVVSGTAVLSGIMYLAWTTGWVEAFPRSIILLMPILVTIAIYSAQHLMNLVKANIWNESKLRSQSSNRP